MRKGMERIKGVLRRKEEGNKGFSMVELIVVIAIMAILAVVIAPQVMKYIEKSRVAADKSNMAHCKTVVSTALADEDAYKDAISLAGTTGTGKVTVEFDGGVPVVKNGGGTAVTTGDFIDEVKAVLSGNSPTSQKSGENDGFEVEVQITSSEVTDVTVDYK